MLEPQNKIKDQIEGIKHCSLAFLLEDFVSNPSKKKLHKKIIIFLE